MTLLFSLIASGRVPEHERLLTILLRQNDYSILPAYWGEDGLFAYKTGVWRASCAMLASSSARSTTDESR